MSTRCDTVPPIPRRRDLWREATNRLSDEDRKILKTRDLEGTNVAQAVLETTKMQKSICEGKQWSFTFKGKQVFVRDVLESIISWVERFKQVVDSIVSMDVSGHAALPWACLKFCLEVCKDWSFPTKILADHASDSWKGRSQIQQYAGWRAICGSRDPFLHSI